MLILTREEVVAALLGLMVEISGFQPRFPAGDQTAAAATASQHPRVLLIDCDHSEFDENLINVIRTSGARPVLFSPLRMHREVTRLASRYGTESFTLPTEPNAFTQLLNR